MIDILPSSKNSGLKFTLACIFLLLSNFAFATSNANIDISYLRELNESSIVVEKMITECAQNAKLPTEKIYLDLKVCESNLLQNSMKQLRTNVIMLAISSFDESSFAGEQQIQASPLLWQLLLEEMSNLSLDKVERSGGNKGFGLCTGFINIGYCVSEPEVKNAVAISETGLKFLRLMNHLSVDSCRLSYFPSVALKMMSEIAEAQSPNSIGAGYSSYQDRNGRVYFGTSQMIESIRVANGDRPDASNLEAQKLMINKIKTFEIECRMERWKSSGVEAFQKLKRLQVN